MSNELENEVRRLKEENELLKKKNEDFIKRIEVLTNLPYDPNKPMSIMEFYCKKYLELFEDSLNARLKKIKEEIISLQKEYNRLEESEDKLAIVASDNHDIENRIAQIDELIQESLLKLENQKFILNNHQKEINDALIRIERETQALYENIITPIINLQYENYEKSYELFINEITKKFIPAVTKIKFLQANVRREAEEVKNAEQEVLISNRILLQEKQELSSKLVDLTNESIEAILEDILNEIARKNQLIQELNELFTTIKKEHLKKITNEIEHFQVIGMSNQEIDCAMDTFLLKIMDELINLDTQSNIQMQKMVELNRLLEKKTSFDMVQEEYAKTQNEYEYLQSLYKTLNDQIEMVEQYIANFEQAIEANSTYRKYYEVYLQMIMDRQTALQEIVRISDELEDVKKYRSSKVSDPFASSEMVLINQKMALLSNELEQKKQDVEQINKTLERDKANKELASLINVIDNMLLCKEKLPSLYQKIHELTLLIDDKYQAVQQLSRRLCELDALLLQIESLENEIKN